MTRDPLKQPEELIRRVYSYVAFRIGPGPDAEDVTSEAMLRAVRYRDSYDSQRGKPVTWLMGIARTCVDDHLTSRNALPAELPDSATTEELEIEALDRLTIAHAVGRLDGRDQELIALKYGADLTTRQIADVLGLTPNAVDVALHRGRTRLRAELEGDGSARASQAVGRPRPQAEPTG